MSGEGLRTAQQTCPSVGAVATGMATEWPWQDLGDPLRLWCQCWSQRNRQTESGPSHCGSEKAGPQGTEARVEAPLGDSACSSLPLLSAVAKIHSLHPCLGANQAPEPLTAAAPG